MKAAFRYGKGLAAGLAGLALTAVCMGSPAEGAQRQEYYLISHGMDIAVVPSAGGDVEALVAGCGYDADDYILDVVRTESYTAVTLYDAMDVSVTADGRTSTARATGGSVAQLLDELGIELGEEDIVSPEPDETLRDGMDVRVYRVTYGEEYVDEALPHGTKYKDNADLTKGTEKTAIEGSDGVKRVYYTVKYVDGAEDSRALSREETVTEAVDTVIERGTKEKAAPKKDTAVNSGGTTQKSDDSDGGNKESAPSHSATAKDGVITTSSGQTYSYSRVLSMKATAYTYSAGSITASGAPVQVGIVAALPSTLPQGTRVYIVTDDGKYTYGPAVVGDTPGGDIIDLFYETDDECRQFGVRQATVYVLS